MPDYFTITGTADAVAVGAARVVGVPVARPGTKDRYASFRVIDYRVTSLDAGERRTSGGARSTQFDVEFYDREKPGTSAVTNLGMKHRDVENDSIALGAFDNIIQNESGILWVRIVNSAGGPADFDIEVLVEPIIMTPPPASARRRDNPLKWM